MTVTSGKSLSYMVEKCMVKYMMLDKKFRTICVQKTVIRLIIRQHPAFHRALKIRFSASLDIVMHY